MTDLERLEKALEFFKAHEWTRGQSQEPLPGGGYAYCAEGALRFGGFPELVRNEICEPAGKEINSVIYKVNRAVQEISEGSYGYLSTYNDAEDRTKEEMVAVFEAAIAKERVSA